MLGQYGVDDVQGLVQRGAGHAFLAVLDDDGENRRLGGRGGLAEADRHPRPALQGHDHMLDHLGHACLGGQPGLVAIRPLGLGKGRGQKRAQTSLETRDVGQGHVAGAKVDRYLERGSARPDVRSPKCTSFAYLHDCRFELVSFCLGPA